MDRPQPEPASPAVPWWRVPMVWLVLAGPAAVVVASFVTLGIALSHPDRVVTAADEAAAAQQPALRARNHAATPPR